MGPSSAPPTIAGMCMIVALPMRGIGTGMKPMRVAPRNSATPPTMPATTICRVLRPKAEPPPLPPEFAANLLLRFLALGAEYLHLCAVCQTRYRGGVKRPSAAVQPPSTNIHEPVV